MKEEASWPFLDAITGSYFHLFSTRLLSAQPVLTEAQMLAMTDLFEVFGLQHVTPYPHMILCDFRVSHEDRMGDHFYFGRVKEFATFQLGDNENTDYLNILRRALCPLIQVFEGQPVKPLTTAVRAIKRSQLGNLIVMTRDLFVSEFSKKFAAAWRLLNWRAGRID